MADEPNKAKGNVNRVGRSGATSGQDIVKQYEHLLDKETKQDIATRQLGRAYREKEREAREALESVNGVSGIGSQEEIDTAKQNLAVIQQARGNISQTFHQSRQAQEMSARGSLITKVNQYTGSADVRSRVNLYRSGTGALAEAQQQVAGGSSYFEMEKRQQAAAGNINQITGELYGIATADKFDKEAFLQKSSEMHEQEKKLAIAERGQKILKASGQTPEAQLLKTQDVLKMRLLEVNLVMAQLKMLTRKWLTLLVV